MPLDLEIEDNLEGWGPTSLPEKFKDIPYYTPFNKGDKLGKVSDWQQVYQKGKGVRDQAGVSTIFTHIHEEDISFQMVDHAKPQSKRFGNRRYPNKGYQHSQGTGTRQKQAQWTQQQQKGKYQPQKKQQWNKRWGQDVPQKKRDLSIEIKPEWELQETIEFSKLLKLTRPEPTPETIKSCGELLPYDKSFDLISTKSEKSLARTNRKFFNVNTKDDPIIQELSKNTQKTTIFGIDSIVTQLMNATRSVIPWDITVVKEGKNIFLNKRDGSIFDYVTVNETSPDAPAEEGKDPNKDPNSSINLVKEATALNQHFSQQVLLKQEPIKFESPHPFKTDNEEVAWVGYRYRKWSLSENVDLVVRCEIDAVSKNAKGEDIFLTVKALNEWDLKTTQDWRKKIDSQRSAVLATELKNNKCKISRWTSQALLAGADSIKLGFISRVSPKDNFNHVILATQDYDPKEFATQITLNQKNTWGILEHLMEIFLNKPDGTYVLLRDNEKNALKIFSVPEKK